MTRKDSFSETVLRELKRKVQTVKEIRQAAVGRRLLPDDLAQQICQAADRERALILERISLDEKRFAALTEQLANARQAERAAWEVTPARTVERERVDGSIYHRQIGPISKKGVAAIEAGKKVRAISNQIEALKAQRAQMQNELNEIRRVKRCAQTRVMSALYAIVGTWNNRVEVGVLAPRIPLARSYRCDSAGNPWPDEGDGW